MTLHQLRIFHSIARFLSVTRAAARLHISQPSVSQQLKLLEDEFNVKLYEKVGQGIRLTRTGLNVLKRVEPILSQVDELARYLEGATEQTQHSVLTVGASYANAEARLPQVLPSFREAYPEVRLHVHADQSAVLEEAVLDARVEIGLFYNPSNHPYLRCDLLGADRIGFFDSRSDPLVTKDEITMEELRQLPIVVQRPSARADIPAKILDHLRKHQLGPNIVMQCDSIASLRAAAAGGAGLGFIIESAAQTQENQLRLVSVRDFDSFSVEACVVYRRDKTLSEPARGFLDLVRALSSSTSRGQRQQRKRVEAV